MAEELLYQRIESFQERANKLLADGALAEVDLGL